MKKAEIVIGEEYVAKISGKLTVVRIISGGTHGWSAVNVNTGRHVRIKSAAKLRIHLSDTELGRNLRAVYLDS